MSRENPAKAQKNLRLCREGPAGDVDPRTGLAYPAAFNILRRNNAMSENKAETVAAAAESNDNPKAGVDFIRARIMDDNASGRFGGRRRSTKSRTR